jgi:hypothetical protein
VSRIAKIAVAAVVAVTGALATPAAAAEGEAEAPEAAPLRKYPQRFVGFEVGARGALVRDAGFDPYAADDRLASLSLGATWEPLRARPVFFGLAGEYDLGERSARARGVPSSLTVHRASIGVRVRWEVATLLSLYAKATPGVLHLRGSLDDAAVDRALVARSWTWTVDAVAGAAVPIVTFGDPAWPAARIWLALEGGYAFAGSASMRFAPADDPSDPRRFGAIDLPALRVAGPVSRLAIATTF